MRNIKNEGTFERIIQLSISLSLWLVAFFWLQGFWQIFLFLFSLLIAVLAFIGFCPLYAIIGKKNRSN